MAEAIGDQIDKVISVGTAADPQASSDIASWPTEYNWPIVFNTKTDYIDNISSDYPADGSDNLRLNFALKQAWFANFGNGFEGYNSFRRTGYPSDIQAPLQLIRQYALSLPYAQDEINLNPNTPQKAYDSPSSAVIWDTLKFQF